MSDLATPQLIEGRALRRYLFSHAFDLLMRLVKDHKLDDALKVALDKVPPNCVLQAHREKFKRIHPVDFRSSYFVWLSNDMATWLITEMMPAITKDSPVRERYTDGLKAIRDYVWKQARFLLPLEQVFQWALFIHDGIRPWGEHTEVWLDGRLVGQTTLEQLKQSFQRASENCDLVPTQDENVAVGIPKLTFPPLPEKCPPKELPKELSKERAPERAHTDTKKDAKRKREVIEDEDVYISWDDEEGEQSGHSHTAPHTAPHPYERFGLAPVAAQNAQTTEGYKRRKINEAVLWIMELQQKMGAAIVDLNRLLQE